MYKQWLVPAYLEIPAEFPMASTCLQLSVTSHATAHTPNVATHLKKRNDDMIIGKKILLFFCIFLLISCNSYKNFMGKTYYAYKVNEKKYYKITFEDSTYTLFDDRCFDSHFGIWKLKKKTIILFDDDFGGMIYDSIKKISKKADTLTLKNKNLIFVNRDILTPNKKLDSIFDYCENEVIIKPVCIQRSE
ncbi:hypothetical protein [Aequorivita marina]|uniref:hypothetical protein n=1 Tax=Aequorivita marina TaxID=3073654 RepID=UPI002876530F|nr:hypothetical protein [Aequorivita sp. S2608]MDS1298761.1 hypothetical protein [Aequorivita sp. S2608]